MLARHWILMNMPSDPNVLSIQLFRSSYYIERDADMHCRNGFDSEGSHQQSDCITCPKWWKAQTWRKDCRDVM